MKSSNDNFKMHRQINLVSLKARYRINEISNFSKINYMEKFKSFVKNYLNKMAPTSQIKLDICELPAINKAKFDDEIKEYGNYMKNKNMESIVINEKNNSKKCTNIYRKINANFLSERNINNCNSKFSTLRARNRAQIMNSSQLSLETGVNAKDLMTNSKNKMEKDNCNLPVIFQNRKIYLEKDNFCKLKIIRLKRKEIINKEKSLILDKILYKKIGEKRKKENEL